MNQDAKQTHPSGTHLLHLDLNSSKLLCYDTHILSRLSGKLQLHGLQLLRGLCAEKCCLQLELPVGQAMSGCNWQVFACCAVPIMHQFVQIR